DRTLLRSYREGASSVEGFAEDYAFLIQGLLDLYEATFDPTWIEWAAHLQTRQDELFWDTKADGYFTTSGKDASILLRSKEAYDGAEPAANSVAALNLMRLSSMLGHADWRERARMTLRAFGGQLMQDPSGMPQMVVALIWLHAKPRQIVIAGKPDAPDTQAMLREAKRLFVPGKIVLLADGGAGQVFLASHVEFMKDLVPVDGKATAYMCEDFVCRLPTHDIAALVRDN
ncbi:MAG: thioredoxin domain-containing protein, partial [bacterium]